MSVYLLNSKKPITTERSAVTKQLYQHSRPFQTQKKLKNLKSVSVVHSQEITEQHHATYNFFREQNI